MDQGQLAGPPGSTCFKRSIHRHERVEFTTRQVTLLNSKKDAITKIFPTFARLTQGNFIPGETVERVRRSEEFNGTEIVLLQIEQLRLKIKRRN